MTDDIRNSGGFGSARPDCEPPHWPLISRYIAGEADDAEAERLERWIARDANLRALIDDLRIIWERGGTPTMPADVNAALLRIKTPDLARKAGRRSIGHRAFALSDRPRAWRRIGVAGMVSIPFFGAAAAGLFLWTAPHSEIPRARNIPITMSKVSASGGERGHVRLGDGTEITLAPLSTVQYASDYGMRSREVTLDGEALFTVTHDVAHPFVVHTAHATATDLGTTFDVRAYSTDRSTVVAVAAGAVSVTRGDLNPAATNARPGAHAEPGTRPPSGTVVLRARDAVRISTNGALRVLHGVSPDQYFAWADGRLVLQDVPLEDALLRLSRWYDADIRLAPAARDTFASYPLTASLRRESLADVVQLLTATLGMTARTRTVAGRTVVTLHRS